MDVLSDVLRMIRLEGAFFLNAEFSEPWCVDAPSSAKLARLLMPGADDLAICHLVLEGRCWVQLQDGAPVALGTGDVVVLPHGDSHLVGSGLQHAPVSLDHVVQIRLPELARVRYGGAGDRTVIVCGWFAYERDIPNPLMTTLPRLFRASLGQRASGPWIEQSIRHALDAAGSPEPGADALNAKVAEALFVEALRGYAESLSPDGTGWLAGLRDPQIGRCLKLLHDAPARAWTVADLAREVHVSRSVLALRFTELVGMPPMQYLKRWRLASAARMLRSDRTGLARVAEGVGYESEAAFNRAFKGEYGVSPGVWRRGGDAAKRVPPAARAPRTPPSTGRSSLD
jgi:AraC-like DNA-binding protein